MHAHICKICSPFVKNAYIYIYLLEFLNYSIYPIYIPYTYTYTNILRNIFSAFVFRFVALARLLHFHAAMPQSPIRNDF